MTVKQPNLVICHLPFGWILTTELEKVLNVPSILKMATEMFLKSAVFFKSGMDFYVWCEAWMEMYMKMSAVPLTEVVQPCPMSYSVARVILILALDCLQNSSPFLGIYALCKMKIGDFRKRKLRNKILQTLHEQSRTFYYHVVSSWLKNTSWSYAANTIMLFYALVILL